MFLHIYDTFYGAVSLNPFCANDAFTSELQDKYLKCGKLLCIIIVLCVEFRSVVNYIAY